MAYNLTQRTIFRNLYITVRRYCEEKSIYQRHEEGEKTRIIHGQKYTDWRKPWMKREGEWSSKLSIFIEKSPNTDILGALQKIPELNTQQIKDWWAKMKVIQERVNQQYLPERTTALGSNLGAVHFFIFRNAAVRLKDSSQWLSGDIENFNLPTHYVDGYCVEAVDCTNFHHNGIRFEGLENLAGLSFLKWLSLKNSKHIDVWCLDRLAGQNGKTLEYLDISDCTLCVGCVYALARMSALKYLVVKDPGENVEVQAALSLLEQERPSLLINTV